MSDTPSRPTGSSGRPYAALVPVHGLPGDARRILVYGVTGSGKTTLAARLADASGIDWHSVEDLSWEPGWVAVPDEERRRRIQHICSRPEWILDTAYGKWLDLPLGHAQLIVALDYPRWFSLQRLIRRTVTSTLSRRLVCNGNREPGIVARAVLARRHHRVALPVLQPQAAADPPVVRRRGRAARPALHLGTSGGAVAGRTPRASTRSLVRR
jgi:adenylate kinase family enzyme